jgi:hypothetical protein
MFTRGPTQRGVRRSGALVRYRWSAALFIAGLGSGCLQVLGDVDVVGDAPPLGTGRAVLAEFPAECGDAGAGPCVGGSCTPDQLRCDRELLEVCAASGAAWGLLEPCATPGLCDPVAGVCRSPVCEPRQYDCAETGDLRVCNADRTGFDPVAHCSSRAFCNSVRGQEGCEPPACSTGDRRCNGAQLEQCRSDQMGYEPVLPACISAALCKQDAPGKAHCEPPTCTAGQYSCDVRELRLCNGESSGWTVTDRCVSAPLCNAASKRCDPVVCQLGEQRCTGSLLERCNPDQSGFTPVVDCPPPLFCDARVMTCLAMEPPPPTPTPTPIPVPATLPPEVASGAAYTFVAAPQASALGLQLSELSVPREWSQVDTSPWLDAAGAALGPRLVISTDTARFASNFDIPGVLFVATTSPPIEAAARLRDFDLSAHCTKDVADTYNDDLYTGPRQAWINCGTTGARTFVVAALPKQSPSFVTVVVVSALAQRDDDARQKVWETFLVAAQ